MSYMRDGSPLQFFDHGVSNMYVFGNGKTIEDYGILHTATDLTLIQLCSKFVYWEERRLGYDHKFSWSVARELSKRMGLLNELRPYKEIFDDEGFIKHVPKRVPEPIIINRQVPNQCPFCGEKSKVLSNENGYYVKCVGCVINQGVEFSSQEEAIENWNSRFLPNTIPAWLMKLFKDEVERLSYEWDNGEQHQSEGYVKDRINFINDILGYCGKEKIEVKLRGE
jgi:hypothetical protein